MTKPLITAETKTRTPSMKWIELGVGKDPEFDKQLFLTEGKGFYCGVLSKIEQEQTGKKHSFNVGPDGSGTDVIATFITHYCYPVLPK
jgi:hypothetical protein